MKERIFHYTSIESLALILQSGRIRFTRLDAVDDLREAQEHSGVSFGKYFFVSCWTLESRESIPQWHLYSRGMEGVRIEAPLYPFADRNVTIPPEWLNVQGGGGISSPLSLEEIFADAHLVVPTFLNRDHFAGPIEYVEDVGDRYAQSVKRITQPTGVETLKVNGLPSLPRVKSQDWAFQQEYRFSLFAVPSPPRPPEGPGASDYGEKLGTHIPNALLRGVDPGIDHIDVKLSEAGIEDLVVRTGPLCSPGGYLCVEALLDKYAPKARLEKSSLHGWIRTRK